jgi:hypothetical protein
MANREVLRPGQRVQVVDPDDGYYLAEGEVEEVHDRTVYVRFPGDDTGQRFRRGQLRAAADAPAEGQAEER